MKDKGDFQVLVEDHFKALRLDNKQREAALSILTDADAIVYESSEKQFSVRIYTDYILFRLDELSNLAKNPGSLDDIKAYGLVTQGFLRELTIIIGNLSHLIAKGCNLGRIDETEKTLEQLIEDMRDVFEHLVNSNKLFIKFGWVLNDNPADSKQ